MQSVNDHRAQLDTMLIETRCKCKCVGFIIKTTYPDTVHILISGANWARNNDKYYTPYCSCLMTITKTCFGEGGGTLTMGVSVQCLNQK